MLLDFRPGILLTGIRGPTCLYYVIYTMYNESPKGPSTQSTPACSDQLPAAWSLRTTMNIASGNRVPDLCLSCPPRGGIDITSAPVKPSRAHAPRCRGLVRKA